MRFLNPAFLWGLLAIAVPIVLHLFLRRRLPVLDFPLTRLVRRAEHSRQPRKRLNRVLLMIARASVLALLALGLSRLTFGGTDVEAHGPVVAVVVVDDSLSMHARAEGGGTLFERGVEAAESLVAALPEGSRVAVVRMSEAATATSAPFDSPDAARATLGHLVPTLRHLDAGPALRGALQILAQTRATDRRLVLVTDLARHSLSDLALPGWDSLAPGESRPRLHVLAPARATGMNLSVSGLDAAVLPGGRLRLAARVGAWGIEKPAQVQLEARCGAVGQELRVAGRGGVVAGLGASEERRFEIAAPPEGFGESVVAIPHDVLPADDERTAVHHVSARPSVLVVDGDPQNLAIGSETFYVEKALSPGVGLDLDADIIPLAELSPAALESRAAILLCNVPDLSDARVDALSAVVRGGAGLFVSLGNRADATVYDGRMAALLPATLGIVRDAKTPASVTAVEGMSELPHVGVRAWFSLEPKEGTRVLLRLSDGSPLLVEGSLGAGRVLLLATTLDRDWTDLPISPRFLAFLRESIDRVSPQGTSAVLPSVLVGAPVPLASLQLGSGASVVGPDGVAVDLARDATTFAATSRPGAYVVREAGQVRAAFAVVTDPVESDLTRVSPDELANAVRDAADAGAAVEGGVSETGGLAAWKALLAALIAVAAAEAWLARRAS